MFLRFAIFAALLASVTSQIVPVGAPVVIPIEPTKSTPPLLTKDCTSPMLVGPCKGLFPRYYFNTVTNQCQSFTYGGCMGNGNNYNTLQDCQAACMA